MTYINAVKYILSLPLDSANFDRARIITEQLRPHSKPIPTVHICGNEGKDSCKRMLVSILKKQGYTVGGFSDNSSADIRDIITLNEEPLTYSFFAQIVSDAHSAYSKLDIIPSASEFLAVCAELCFIDQGCDIAILEKSYGKNSSANIFNPPILSVITVIDGDLPSDIEFDSILRRGTRETVTSPQHKDIYNLISECCAAIGSRLTLPIYSELEVSKVGLFKTSFQYEGTSYSIRSFAPSAMIDAITVIEAARALTREDIEISEESIASGIALATFPYKCETLSVNPSIVSCAIDGGDLRESVIASIAQLKALIDGKLILCTESTSSGYEKALASRKIVIERAITIPCGLTASKLNREVKDIISTVLGNDAILIIGGHTFVADTSNEIKKLLSRV